MKQPVLVVLDVPDQEPNTFAPDLLGRALEEDLRSLGYKVQWAIPVQRTNGVPAGMITHA